MLTEKKIDNRMKKIIALKAEKKALELEIEMLEDEIKNEMENNEILETNNFVIRYTFVTGSRFDSKKLKSEFPDIYEKFKVETNSRRFSYKEK